METNRKMIFAEAISDSEKTEIVSILLNGMYYPLFQFIQILESRHWKLRASKELRAEGYSK